MGTRSIVAVPTEDGGWKGRYVHWDGYPTGVGLALLKIVQRDGLATARRVLTEDHYGWSSVNAEGDPLHDTGRDAERFEVVPGYGVAYTHAEQGDEWLASNGDTGWTEWAYVLHDDHLAVYDLTYSGPRLVGVLPYDHNEDENDLLFRVETGEESPPDTESSASRQHYIDTGYYLPMEAAR